MIKNKMTKSNLERSALHALGHGPYRWKPWKSTALLAYSPQFVHSAVIPTRFIPTRTPCPEVAAPTGSWALQHQSLSSEYSTPSPAPDSKMFDIRGGAQVPSKVFRA